MAKPTLPPYTLQVLTGEYLIDGTVPANTYLFFPKLDAVGVPIHITSAQVQLTRTTEVTARSYTDYFLTLNNSLAYIPHMDVTQHPQYASWKQYKNPINGVFHLGPYLMEGKLMLVSPGYLSGEMPIYDVRFRSQIPGTHWGDLSAPFALVNGLAIQGWELC